jgi:hypothetical protein
MGLLEWNEDSPQRMAVSAEDAAKTLRDFIAYSGCEEFASFLKAYDACELDRCSRLTQNATISSWRQLPLWLFELHNAVNLRLMKERYEREGRVVTPEDELNTRWPPKEECPMCFDDGILVEDSVLKHLRVEYWLVNAPFLSKVMSLVQFALQFPSSLLAGQRIR